VIRAGPSGVGSSICTLRRYATPLDPRSGDLSTTSLIR
jgi:hypothetical protein